MNDQFRPVDIAKIIHLGANRPQGKAVTVDYGAAHGRLKKLWQDDQLSYEQYELLEWCLWLHKAANLAMAAFENIGLDDDEEIEIAWYKLLCANEDTPKAVKRLIATASEG